MDSERLVPNVHRAYAEHHGTPPDERLTVTDMEAALNDMFTFHGGRPPCLA
ncbi:hypothetical protein ACWD6P_29825 [Streptomyces sp. NPDC002446]